jgi:cardiolipin synthase
MGYLLKRSINLIGWLLVGVGIVLLFVLAKRARLFDWEDFVFFRSVLKGGLSLYVFILGFYIFYDNRNPHKTISWLLILVASPLLGFFFYLIFGRSFRKRKISQTKHIFTRNTMEKWAGIQVAMVDVIGVFNRNLVSKRLVNLLLNNSKSPFFLRNRIAIYKDGDSFFEMFLQDIQEAKHHIHMEYFIIRNDHIGNIVKDLLIKKAQEGLEVRLIYDSVGCWRLSKTYLNALKEGGVQVFPFLPMVFPIFGRELNYRNHRKITVIDGKIGYIGGMNIGDEYRGHSKHLGFWRDTHMRLYGEGVMGLQHYFLMDWAFVSHQLLIDEEYLAIEHPDEEALVQIAASGPDTDWEIILQAYFTMIATAKTRIWITTPYLVPEDSVMSGLVTAALSGVDVRIIIPSKADHFLVYWATRANLEKLLRSGVKIYTYEKGFIHSKTMIVDHGVASVGTANLDIRSLEINFEINAFLYGENEIKQLSDDFEGDLKDSTQIEYEEYLKRSRGQRVLEAIGRLVSPLQ